MSMRASTLTRETSDAESSIGSAPCGTITPSMRKRTRSASRLGSTWMSLAPLAKARRTR
jgi:hypothetical protein